ncbi:MAG TPA: hypothetical protein VJV78_45765 [Polyangiales bacterium]|nr:hypothetical protein [Polyangiales bacterium]
MKFSWLFASCLLCVAAGGCSGDSAPVRDAGSDPDSGEQVDPSVKVDDPSTPFDQLPSRCKGFEVKGMKYSPGGDVLPNTCAPFDNLRNNPYAIRCIDADANYTSGYPGDEFCILPPSPERGTQVHVGPPSFTDVPADFLMQPGQEKVDYYYTNATTTEDHSYYRTNLRMRAGSHHMIIRVQSADRKDGFSSEQDLGAILRADTETNRSFGGSQRPDTDRPEGILAVPPENADMGELLQAGQQFSFNLHHFNVSDKVLLREAWVNVWYKDASEIGRRIQGISIIGNPSDLNIPAGEHRVLHYQCPVTAPVRVITLNGHRHASTSRFGAWVVRKDGSTQSVYESFDYNDMPTYQYDSLSKNPTPNLDRKQDGATSGQLELEAGDQLHFVCDVTNKLQQPLHFANEVNTGEMCILFGTRTGGSLCSIVTRSVE